jgi:hypothetical protein
MIRLCDLRWRRRRRGPSDLPVGKVGDFWVMVIPRRHQIGKEDSAHDLPYATMFISARSRSTSGRICPHDCRSGLGDGTTIAAFAA